MSAHPAPQVESEPTRKYTVLSALGHGGSSNISAAIAQGIGGFRKLVVLKTLRQDIAMTSGAAKEFLDEARVSARMNHPNVVQVYEVFEQNHLPVIVMEYLDGQSLATILKSGFGRPELSLAFYLSILVKTLAGLQHAHSLCDFSGEPLNLVHRDVSPHNVMVTYDGQVKLVDFGIASLRVAEQQTPPVAVRGKLRYMAPEQLMGLLDRRADVFAVGVMLWEVVARRRFWGGLGDSEIMSCLLKGDIPSVLDATPDVDFELKRICAKALAADREERYATAATMQEDLERYLVNRLGLVPESVIGQVLAGVCADGRDGPRSEIRSRLSELGLSLTDDGGDVSQRRLAGTGALRHRGWWALIALGVLCIGVVSLVLVTGSDQTAQAPAKSDHATSLAPRENESVPPTTTPETELPNEPAHALEPVVEPEPPAVAPRPASNSKRPRRPPRVARRSTAAPESVTQPAVAAQPAQQGRGQGTETNILSLEPGSDLRRLRWARHIDEDILK